MFAADKQVSGNVPEDVSGEVSMLQMGIVGLLAWVVVMTLALVAIAIVVFRKWRQRADSFDVGSISEASSNADLSDVTSTSGSIGESNSAFEGEGGTKL